MATVTKKYTAAQKSASALQVSINSSTGYSLNLPAIKSCPGSTAACEAVCYANRGRYLMNGKWVTDHNWDVLQGDVTAVERIKWPMKSIKNHRLLGSGDLYSVPFARSMFRMCDQNPDAGFWMYTRSFAVLREILEERAVPKNLVLFISADECNVAEAESMATLFDLPVAYMGKEVRPDVDAFVCPKTNGSEHIKLSRRVAETACQKCRFCIENSKPGFVDYRKRKSLRFYEH